MADEAGPVAKPAAFWGSILLAARLHADTATVWAAIRDYAKAYNVALPPGMFTEVNRMRSLATSLRTSGEALAKASGSDAITSTMIGQQLYARSPLERALAPAYHVRFELQTITGEGTQTSWYTLEYPGTLPPTVGELTYEVARYADSLAGAYGAEVGSLGSIEIGEF